MTLINRIIKNITAGLLGLGLAAGVQAQTHYFDPAHPGHGVSVSLDSGQGSAFIWYLYNRSGDPTWLISTENCTSYPCVTPLAQANGAWMGGEFELVVVGHVEVSWTSGKLVWEYNLSEWDDAGDCGRLVWLYQTRCLGTFEMVAID